MKPYRRVPDPLAQRLGIYPSQSPSSRVAVPNVVQPDAGQTRLSQRVGHASVSFTMETYMHGDLEPTVR